MEGIAGLVLCFCSHLSCTPNTHREGHVNPFGDGQGFFCKYLHNAGRGGMRKRGEMGLCSAYLFLFPYNSPTHFHTHIFSPLK